MELTANKSQLKKKSYVYFETMLRNTAHLNDILQMKFRYEASEYGQE
jgi:hypothetical protein